MTIETTLTRVLEIRFIDARALTTEAKVNLGIDGYISRNQEQEIIKEAIKLFIDRPETEQQDMKSLREKLDEALKTIYKAPVSSSGASVAGSIGKAKRSISVSSETTATSTSASSEDEVSVAASDKMSVISTASGRPRRGRKNMFRMMKKVRQ